MNIGTKPKTLAKFQKAQKLIKEENLKIGEALERTGLSWTHYCRLKKKYGETKTD